MKRTRIKTAEEKKQEQLAKLGALLVGGLITDEGARKIYKELTEHGR